MCDCQWVGGVKTRPENEREAIQRLTDENKLLRAERNRYWAGIVALYRDVPLPVARVCDGLIDPSGRLLGEVRQAARG